MSDVLLSSLPLSEKVQTNSITVGKVWMSPPPLSTICSSHRIIKFSDFQKVTPLTICVSVGPKGVPKAHASPLSLSIISYIFMQFFGFPPNSEVVPHLQCENSWICHCVCPMFWEKSHEFEKNATSV